VFALVLFIIAKAKAVLKNKLQELHAQAVAKVLFLFSERDIETRGTHYVILLSKHLLSMSITGSRLCVDIIHMRRVHRGPSNISFQLLL
jgi:hypothetical protein